MTATETPPRSRIDYLLAQARDAFVIADYDSAMHDFVEEALAKEPDNQTALWFKALILYREKKWQRAIEILLQIKRPTTEQTVTLGWARIFLGQESGPGKVGSASADVVELLQCGLRSLNEGLSQWAKDCRGQVSDEWRCHVRNLRRKGYSKVADELERQAEMHRKLLPPKPRQQRRKKRHGGR